MPTWLAGARGCLARGERGERRVEAGALERLGARGGAQPGGDRAADEIGEQRAIERGEQGDRHRAADRVGSVIGVNIAASPNSVPTMPIAGAASAAPRPDIGGGEHGARSARGGGAQQRGDLSGVAPSTIAASAAASRGRR